MDRAHISIANRIPEIRRAGELLDEFCRRHAVPRATVNDAQVVLDEVLSNIMRHAYGDNEAHEIGVSLAMEGEDLVTEVEDDGRPFDPTMAAVQEARRPDPDKPGGLGLVFVRALSDRMNYRRLGGRNHLTIRRRIAAQAISAGDSRQALHFDDRDGVLIARPAGRLDSAAAAGLRARLLERIEAGVLHVVIDLSSLDYATSAGFWVFLSADRLLQERGGSLVLCCPGRDVMRLLERSGFDRLLAVDATQDEALARLRSVAVREHGRGAKNGNC